jgi:tRNA (guanine-N7-)-methyltransferase
MSRSAQMRVSRTKDVPIPNAYISALLGEYAQWSYDEERAPTLRGEWRAKAFLSAETTALDLEIGTGNGLHFAQRSAEFPERCLLGIELKYKPLIQSIRRALQGGQTNVRIARYNAYLLPELFVPQELNDVFIFFPDPWEKSRNHKHRLIQDLFLARLFEVQRPGSRLFFKTDSHDYFKWSLTRFARSPYTIEGHTFDLHQSPFVVGNFITQFERIFMQQGVPIGYACLIKT